MEKNKVVAYLITESVSEPCKINNLQVFDKNSLFYIRFDTNLQDFNVLNRNRRMYMGEAMIPSLNAEHIMELEENQSWCGEAGHPDTSDPKRILTIDPKLISHRIVTHNVSREKCTGTIETLDTTYGRDMTKVILQGLNSAFSLRALAPLVQKGDGTSVVRTKAHVVTYDWVILPSHKMAYQDKSKPVQKIIQNLTADGNTTVNESTSVAVTEAAVLDYIVTESSRVKIISNVCEVALSAAKISKDHRNVILTEGADTFIIPIEDKIKMDVASYMRKL